MSDMDCEEQSPRQGSDVIDLPEDFFDDFAKEEFLAGLDVVDNWSNPRGICFSYFNFKIFFKNKTI